MRASAKTLAVGTLAAVSLLIAPAAIAADSTATVEVAPGVITLTPGAADLTLQTANAVKSTAGVMALTVDDATGTEAGWTIAQKLSGDFMHSTTGDTIPAANLDVTSVTNVSKTAGADMSAPAADAAAITTGANVDLAAGGTVLTAATGQGEGNYTAQVGLALEIPAYQPAGTYTATLTTTNAPYVAPVA